MKEILAALSKITVQFILDWKMPAFRCLMYASIPALYAIKEGLMEYNHEAALPELAWLKIKISAYIGAATAVVAFLDSSYGKAKEAIKPRNGEGASFQTEFITKAGTEPATDK